MWFNPDDPPYLKMEKLQVIPIPKTTDPIEKAEYFQRVEEICREKIADLKRIRGEKVRKHVEDLIGRIGHDAAKIELKGTNMDISSLVQRQLYNTAMWIKIDMVDEHNRPYTVPEDLEVSPSVRIMSYLYLVCACFVEALSLVDITAEPLEDYKSSFLFFMNDWLADLLLNVSIPMTMTEETIETYMNEVGKLVVNMCKDYFAE
jgi:hypothetical protein